MTEHIGLRFERATPADAGRILALEAALETRDREVYVPHASLADVENDIASCSFYTIWQGNDPIGTVSFETMPKQGEIYIGNVAVHPGARRKGVGRAAVTHALVNNPGARRFALVTHPRNAGAKALYAGLGFVDAGTEFPAFAPETAYTRMIMETTPERDDG